MKIDFKKTDLRAQDGEEFAKQIPHPTGYKILISIPEFEAKTAGGIVLPDEFRSKEETATMVGLVLKLGPDAYRDQKRFPGGPYCKEGHYVIFRAYSGTRLSINDKEYRLINDDSVEAVVEDPTAIKRA